MTTVSSKTPMIQTYHGHAGRWSRTWSFARHSTERKLSLIVAAREKSVHTRVSNNKRHGSNRSLRVIDQRESISVAVVLLFLSVVPSLEQPRLPIETQDEKSL